MQSTKEIKASKQAEQKYSGKGLVMGVISADSIVLKHSGKEDPFDGIVHLAFVQAPRIGSSQRVEEPFAFEAREAIREKIIGRKCSFTVQYQINGRRYLTLKVDDEDVASLLVSQGLAKPTEKRSSTEQGGPHEALLKLSEEPKAKKVGVWAIEPKHIEKHTRQVVYFGESDYMPAKLLAEANKEAKPLAAILEHVFSASYVTLYVYRLQTVVKMSLLHLFTPQSTDKDILEKGKAFMEKMLLHKTVGLKLARVDESGGLVGRIFFPAGEIAAEILKGGFSKLSTPKDSNFDAAYYKELKQAQIIGQTKRAGIWHDLKDSELQQNKSKVADFSGRVVEINSGDSLTIEKDSDLSHERVFLSSVKAPGLGRVIKGETTGAEPYSWESKESLRKLAIGKKVKVEMEYSRDVQSSRGGADFTMNFGAIFLTQKNRNLAVQQLERGLVKTNIRQSGENASKYLEDLLAAEKKAADSKLCLHNQKSPPQAIFADLIGNTKQAKEYESMVMKKSDRRFVGVVEHCFSGMKLKVRLDQEGRTIALNLLGVKTMASDKNQPIFDEYANDALQLAKDTLFQRDVTVELSFADKRGTFFGSLTMPNKTDFATRLLEEGLAQIHLQGGKQAVPHIEQMRDAEKKAQQKEIGIWGKSLKLMSSQSSQSAQFEPFQQLKVEMTDITDASFFHVRVVGKGSSYKKIDDAMAKFDAETAEELERPLKKGTLCAALYARDNKWYRCKVIRTVEKGRTEVQFIDYGNTEVVRPEQDLRKLPAHLLAFEPQAIPACFAYVRCPRLSQLQGTEAAKYVQKYGQNTTLEACVAEQDGQVTKFILMEEDEEDWNSSLNAYIVSEGLAVMEKNVPDDVSEDLEGFYEFETEAQEKAIGLWKQGPVVNLSDDEY